MVVHRTDGSRAVFVAERLESHPKTMFSTVAVYGLTPEATVRLITCYGAFDEVTRSYYDNLVAFVVLREVLPPAT